MYWPSDTIDKHKCIRPYYMRVYFDEKEDSRLTRRCICGLENPDRVHLNYCFFCADCCRWLSNYTEHKKRCKPRGKPNTEDRGYRLQCDHCSVKIVRGSMARHLKRKHPEFYKRLRGTKGYSRGGRGDGQKRKKGNEENDGDGDQHSKKAKKAVSVSCPSGIQPVAKTFPAKAPPSAPAPAPATSAWDRIRCGLSRRTTQLKVSKSFV